MKWHDFEEGKHFDFGKKGAARYLVKNGRKLTPGNHALRRKAPGTWEGKSGASTETYELDLSLREILQDIEQFGGSGNRGEVFSEDYNSRDEVENLLSTFENNDYLSEANMTYFGVDIDDEELIKWGNQSILGDESLVPKDATVTVSENESFYTVEAVVAVDINLQDNDVFEDDYVTPSENEINLGGLMPKGESSKDEYGDW